jgi:hypothetical protein
VAGVGSQSHRFYNPGRPVFVSRRAGEEKSGVNNFISGMHEFSAGATKYGKKFGALPASEKDQYFGELLAAAEAALTSAIGAGAGSVSAPHRSSAS